MLRTLLENTKFTNLYFTDDLRQATKDFIEKYRDDILVSIASYFLLGRAGQLIYFDVLLHASFSSPFVMYDLREEVYCARYLDYVHREVCGIFTVQKSVKYHKNIPKRNG